MKCPSIVTPETSRLFTKRHFRPPLTRFVYRRRTFGLWDIWPLRPGLINEEEILKWFSHEDELSILDRFILKICIGPGTNHTKSNVM